MKRDTCLPAYRRANLPLMSAWTSSGLKHKTTTFNPSHSDEVFHSICHSEHHLQIEHDFAEQHVFEGRDGSGAVDGVVALKGLVEVRVRRLPVFLLGCVNDPWKQTHETSSAAVFS